MRTLGDRVDFILNNGTKTPQFNTLGGRSRLLSTIELHATYAAEGRASLSYIPAALWDPSNRAGKFRPGGLR